MGESLTGLKRSCMCCDVNETMIGQEVTVMGWVQRRRDLGPSRPCLTGRKPSAANMCLRYGAKLPQERRKTSTRT